MEEVILRFPHLGRKIVSKLDNIGLVLTRGSSRTWCTFLDGQRIFKIRRIEATVKKFHVIGNSWNLFFKKATFETIVDFVQMVDKFYRHDPKLGYANGMTPLHVAAKKGHLEIFELIISDLKDVNPRLYIISLSLQFKQTKRDFNLLGQIGGKKS